MCKYLSYLIFLLFLSGCVNCPIKNVETIQPIEYFKEIKSSTIGANTLHFSIDNTDIVLKPCGGNICGAITLSEKNSFQWLDNIVSEINNKEEIVSIYYFSSIHYNQNCYKNNDITQCDKNDITNLSNIEKKLNFTYNEKHFSNRYFIKPNSVINGSVQLKKETSTYFYTYHNQQEYYFTIDLKNKSPLFLKLPDVKINNKIYSLPILIKKNANKKVCEYKAW